MRYSRVCIESLGYVLPEEVVASSQLEARLGPLYERLRLPEGRLELMSGIRERRFYQPGTLPSTVSGQSCELALEAAEFDRGQVGALIHGSVCRDYLEPATASTVHHLIGLPRACQVYDVSNACLGILNGMVQIANLIELGAIEAGLVVGSESGRQLVETTIAALNADESLTRQSVKSAIASLTIGSASCAVLLVDRELSQTGNRLTAAIARAATESHQLCRSGGGDEAIGSGMAPLMNTDSEALLREGIALGREAFEQFLEEAELTREGIDRTICHQVGIAHQRQQLEALGLPESRDFITYPWLGNTGSAALPTTLARALEEGIIQPGQQVAMLGIGSGINTLMLAGRFEKGCVRGKVAG